MKQATALQTRSEPSSLEMDASMHVLMDRAGTISLAVQNVVILIPIQSNFLSPKLQKNFLHDQDPNITKHLNKKTPQRTFEVFFITMHNFD